MSAYALAFLVVGPACLVLGLVLGHLMFAGKSSSPADPLTDAQLKELAMAVYAEVQPSLDALNAAVGELPAKVVAAVSKGDPASQQDKADTIAAVNSASQAAVDAINAVGS